MFGWAAALSLRAAGSLMDKHGKANHAPQAARGCVLGSGHLSGQHY